MSSSQCLRLTFWGVRGSIPVPENEFLGHGGNTPCVEIRYGLQPPIVLDAGSGLRTLGLSLDREFAGRTLEAHLFLSHFHWDHIQGIPYLTPMYSAKTSLMFYSIEPSGSLRQILRGQMLEPYFPISLPRVQADTEYRQMTNRGQAFGDLLIVPFPLQHPGGCTGYLIKTPKYRVVYATDHEHGDRECDAALLEAATGADLLIYDAQYTSAEYEHRRGWGHSTWLEGTSLARRAGVKKLILFHHDPQRDDPALTEIVTAAQQVFPSVCAAREGWTISLDT